MDKLRRPQKNDVRQREKREAKEQQSHPGVVSPPFPQLAHLPGQGHQQKHQNSAAEIAEALILPARAIGDDVAQRRIQTTALRHEWRQQVHGKNAQPFRAQRTAGLQVTR